MPKRTLAAALALAVVLPLLVFVDPQPTGAHTKTVKRCAFDPFAGRQCWTENVPHTHKPPTTTTTAAPPTTAPPPPCPAGQHRHGTGSCHSHPPPTTSTPPTTTMPPTTTTIYVPPRCPAGTHRYGETCHADHRPPCGTGTWTPHAGHSPQQRPPCSTTTTEATKTTTVPVAAECKRLVGRSPQTGNRHKHSLGNNRNGRSMTGCHQVNVSHCPSGQHEHVHGSLDCHKLGSPAKNASVTHSGWTDHCPPGHHSHAHAGSCHPADPPYYTGVKVEKIEIASGHICYTTNTKAHGRVKSCTRVPADGKLADKIEEGVKDGLIAANGLLVCAAAASAGGVPGLICGGLWIAATVVGEVLCLQPFCTKPETPPVIGDSTKKPPPTTTTTEAPPPTTAPPSTTEAPTPTTAPPPTTTAPAGPVTQTDVTKAWADWRAGRINSEQLAAVMERFYCSLGYRPAKECQ